MNFTAALDRVECRLRVSDPNVKLVAGLTPGNTLNLHYRILIVALLPAI